MKRLFLVATFLLLIFLLDFAIGVIVRRSLPEVNVGSLGVVNNGLRDSSQLLVLGSSRALHHYDSKVMEEALGLSCYNAGLGGHGLPYSYALLAERVLRHKPKTVILDVSPNVLVDSKALEKLTVFLPFTDCSRYFDEIVKLSPGINPLSKHINSIKYNSILSDLVLNGFGTTSTEKGYIPISGSLNLESYKPVFATGVSSNDFNHLYLKRIVEICHKNHLTVVMTISPSYDDFDSTGIIKRYLTNFAVEQSIPFFDYSGDKAFVNKPELFKDQLHLNREGAALYSSDLASRLATLLLVHKDTHLMTTTVD